MAETNPELIKLECSKCKYPIVVNKEEFDKNPVMYCPICTPQTLLTAIESKQPEPPKPEEQIEKAAEVLDSEQGKEAIESILNNPMVMGLFEEFGDQQKDILLKINQLVDLVNTQTNYLQTMNDNFYQHINAMEQHLKSLESKINNM